MQWNRPFCAALLCCAIVCLTTKSVSAAPPARLNYQQAQLLKDAQYYLLQVEGNLTKFDEQSAKWKVGDPTVQARDVDGILSTRKQIDTYLGYAADRFKQLPAEHPDVAKEAKHMDEVKAHLEKTWAHLNELKAGLAGVVAQGGSDEFKTDFARLLEINRTFQDTGLLHREPKRDVETVKQLEPVKAERKRFADKYAALLNQNSAEAQDMKNQLQQFDEVVSNFEKQATAWKQQATTEIDQALSKALGDAKDAAAQKKAAWFRPDSGIASRLNQTQDTITLLAAFDPSGAEAKAAQSKLDQTRAEVASIAVSLEADILEANRPPEDRFSAPDKDALIGKMKEKWSAEGPKGDVLKVGMIGSGWTRDTRWKWSGSAWYKVDYSWTQGYVIRKLDDNTAAIYHINFSKDHLKNDEVSLGFFDDVNAEPSIERKMLVKYVR